jgi:hypothetical protein
MPKYAPASLSIAFGFLSKNSIKASSVTRGFAPGLFLFLQCPSAKNRLCQLLIDWYGILSYLLAAKTDYPSTTFFTAKSFKSWLYFMARSELGPNYWNAARKKIDSDKSLPRPTINEHAAHCQE